MPNKRKQISLCIDGSKDPETTPTSSGLMLALEPRYMYDAAGLVTGMEVTDTVDSTDTTNSFSTEPEQTSNDEILTLFENFAPLNQRSTTEIIFIDSAVRDQQTLLNGITSPDAEVIILDANQDDIVYYMSKTVMPQQQFLHESLQARNCTLYIY